MLCCAVLSRAVLCCPVLCCAMQSALQRPDSDEVLDSLNSLFVTRASGKETPPDVEASGPQQAALLDTWVLFLSVDILLLLVSDAEALADMVPPHQRASAELRNGVVVPPEVVVEDAAAGGLPAAH